MTAPATMRAVVCEQPTGIDDLRLTDFPVPSVGPQGVRIGIRVAAVNPPDGLMAAGRYQVKPSTPFVLGVEGAGVVEEIGAEVDSLAVGDRVMTYAGVGCFAEQAVVDDHLVHRIPDDMPFADAAGFALGYGTVYHGLVDRGAMTSNDTVAVLGAAGGLGLCAIQLAKAMDAHVIAAAGTPEKVAACLAAGADAGVVSRADTLKDDITAAAGGHAVSVIHDTVGGDLSLPALRSLAPLGRHLIVGYASGAIPELPANYILLKQVSVVGVSYRQHVQQRVAAARASMVTLLDLWRAGSLRPTIHATFPLDEYAAALNALASRGVVGKVLIRVRDDA